MCEIVNQVFMCVNCVSCHPATNTGQCCSGNITEFYPVIQPLLYHNSSITDATKSQQLTA